MNIQHPLIDATTALGLATPRMVLAPSGEEVAVWGPEITGESAWRIQKTLNSQGNGWHAFVMGGDLLDADDLASEWEALSEDDDSSAQELESLGENDARAEFSLPSNETPVHALVTGRLELPEDSPLTEISGTLIAMRLTYPGDVIAHLEWEGADNWGSRSALSVILRRWYLEAGAIPLHLSDTDEATMTLAIADLPRLIDDVQAACDEFTVLTTTPSETTIAQLWWD